jgi:hypothetical protein
MASPEAHTLERRRSDRFLMELPLSYTTLNRRAATLAGKGKTVNISSCGVLFSAEHELSVGTRLKVSINWPAALTGGCLLSLVARGRISRHDRSGRLALQIEQHEFRTRSRSGT